MRVHDDDGYSDDTVTVTVNNVKPTVNAGTNETIAEGDTFTQAGSFSDPGADTWTAEVDYGEGAGFVALAVDQATQTFALSNPYQQDGVYTVKVKVYDGTEWSLDTAVVTVTATNVLPTVDAGPDKTIDEGSTFSSSGSFTDPGDDTWTAEVRWSDSGTSRPDAHRQDLRPRAHLQPAGHLRRHRARAR